MQTEKTPVRPRRARDTRGTFHPTPSETIQLRVDDEPGGRSAAADFLVLVGSVFAASAAVLVAAKAVTPKLPAGAALAVETVIGFGLSPAVGVLGAAVCWALALLTNRVHRFTQAADRFDEQGKERLRQSQELLARFESFSELQSESLLRQAAEPIERLERGIEKNRSALEQVRTDLGALEDSQAALDQKVAELLRMTTRIHRIAEDAVRLQRELGRAPDGRSRHQGPPDWVAPLTSRFEQMQQCADQAVELLRSVSPEKLGLLLEEMPRLERRLADVTRRLEREEERATPRSEAAPVPEPKTPASREPSREPREPARERREPSREPREPARERREPAREAREPARREPGVAPPWLRELEAASGADPVAPGPPEEAQDSNGSAPPPAVPSIQRLQSPKILSTIRKLKKVKRDRAT